MKEKRGRMEGILDKERLSERGSPPRSQPALKLGNPENARESAGTPLRVKETSFVNPLARLSFQPDNNALRPT